MSNSICIFHNGNRRIVDYYKNKFNHLFFIGNWACNEYKDNCLYEIYYNDANSDNLIDLKKNNVKIIRHITDYDDDLKNQVDQHIVFTKTDWLNYVVSNNLCYSDVIISDYIQNTDNSNRHAVITTGRTANAHYREYLKSIGIDSFEYSRSIDSEFLNSSAATLLWREDSWETATSLFIAANNYYFHNISGTNRGGLKYFIIKELKPAGELTVNWLNDWNNQCHSVLNHALFYKYILNKPLTVETYNDVIKKYSTVHQKNNYKKEDLIENYHTMKKWYYENIDSTINLIYNSAITLLK